MKRKPFLSNKAMLSMIVISSEAEVSRGRGLRAQKADAHKHIFQDDLPPPSQPLNTLLIHTHVLTKTNTQPRALTIWRLESRSLVRVSQVDYAWTSALWTRVDVFIHRTTKSGA